MSRFEEAPAADQIPEQRRDSFWKTASSISLAVHLFLFALAVCFLTKVPPQVRQPIFIDLTPAPLDLVKKTEQESQRVVQTIQGQKAEVPLPRSFLGEQTQTVDRQTVSRDKIIQMGKSLTTKPSTKSEDRAASAKATAVPMQSLGIPLLPTAKELDKIARDKSDGHDDTNFASQGEQAPKEYIEGLKEGQQTALNTREFMFYGYFQRIRERLDRAWVPILRKNIATLYFGGRHLASEMDYSTKVLVVMNSTGEITRVELQTASGARDLDDAAVKAFNEAGPFPNPPTGMVDGHGEIRIPWEFILRT